MSINNYYKVPEVESFMIEILEKKGKVEPVFDLKHGYRYPDVEETIKKNSIETIDFLDKLYNLKILDKEIYDMELRCSKCNNPRVSTNYVCPHCNSTLIRKTILLEHHSCGYIGTVTSFGEPLLCPKCKARVLEGEYRNAGSIYECSSCKTQIETPFVGHWCGECGFRFSFENAIYQPKYAYFPTELTKKEMEKGILYIRNVDRIFSEHGLKKELNLKITGISGIEHMFDSSFSGFEEKFYADIFFSLDPMNEMDVLKEYSKVGDVKGNIYVIAMPGLDEKASELAKTYKMNLIEGKKPEEVLLKLSNTLSEKISELKANLLLNEPVKMEPKKESFIRSLTDSLKKVFRRNKEKQQY